MIRQAYHPGEPGYKDVGGAGVGVYQPWKASFDNFLNDMGTSKGRRLKRKDESRSFCPSNCMWGE
jgi:hypothetical protein